MSNKKQNKDEYVKPFSLSLKPSTYEIYKAHAKKNGLNFSEMVRVLFEEDMDDEKQSVNLTSMVKRDKKKAERLKKLKTLK